MTDEEVALEQPAANRVRRLLMSGLVVSVAVFAANASNFVFQVTTGRLLSSSEYGLLLSAFTLMSLLTVVVSATQAAISKTEATRLITDAAVGLGADAGNGVGVAGANDQTRIQRFLAGLRELGQDRLAVYAIQAGVLGGVVAVAISPFVADFLKSDVSVALAMAASVPTLATTAVVFGRLQGRQQFQLFALISLSVALVKLAGGIGFAYAGYGTEAILAVIAFTSLAITVIGLPVVRRPGPAGMRNLTGEVLRALVVLVCWRAILGMDIPLARFWLGDDQAGQYAAAAVIGRGILWLPEIVSFILFPSLATAVAEGTDSGKQLRQALAATLAICVLGIVTLWLLGSQIFGLLYGSRFPEASDLAWKVALASLPNVAANLFMFAALARKEWRWIIVLVLGTLAQVGIMIAFHGSPEQLIVGSAVGGILAVSITSWAARNRTSRTGVSAPPSPLDPGPAVVG